jgi:hypothetical protein
MMPADLKRLHKYMLEIEHISVISDEVRAVVEEEWPELAHKLPPALGRVLINAQIAAPPSAVQKIASTLGPPSAPSKK